jgi:hypothetical protein
MLKKHRRLSSRARQEQREILIQKYGFKCWWCGKRLTKHTLTIDHFVPLHNGGSNQIRNLRNSCYACNQARSVPHIADKLYLQNLMEYEKEIRLTLQGFRRQALTQFMGQFVQILDSEGYTFEDLLNALANHMHTSGDLVLVECVPMLEKLIDYSRTLNQDVGSDRSSS